MQISDVTQIAHDQLLNNVYSHFKKEFFTKHAQNLHKTHTNVVIKVS